MDKNLIKVACCPEDWITSVVRVAGVEGYDTQLAIPACDLPDDLQLKFSGIIAQLQELGKGNWHADFIVCTRRYAQDRTYLQPNGEAVQVKMTDGVLLRITATAGTSIQEFSRLLDDADSVALYDALVSPDTWVSLLAQPQAPTDHE